MNKKLSELKNEEYIFVEYKGADGQLEQVGDLLADYEQYYKNKEELAIYTTKQIEACLNANDILVDAIQNEECDNMYEGWGEKIWENISEQDITDIQNILDKILKINPKQNISYRSDELVEIDI